jgi:hypothetical protein
MSDHGPKYALLNINHPIDGKRIHVPLHNYLWLKANGLWDKGQTTTPEGFNIHHKDFDPFNNEIDNLELITASEHSSLHWNREREQKLAKYQAKLDAMTPESREAQKNKWAESMKKHYASMTPEARKAQMVKIRVHHQKLTEDDVREIRRVYATLKGTRTGEIQKLAERFGLKSRQHIRAIVSRRLFPNVK